MNYFWSWFVIVQLTVGNWSEGHVINKSTTRFIISRLANCVGKISLVESLDVDLWNCEVEIVMFRRVKLSEEGDKLHNGSHVCICMHTCAFAKIVSLETLRCTLFTDHSLLFEQSCFSFRAIFLYLCRQ